MPRTPDRCLLSKPGLETTTDDLIGVDDRAWEVVLAGDVFYDAEFSARVLGWLGALAQRGAVVLLGDPYRGNVPSEHVDVLWECDAPFDTDVRGLHLKRAQVARVKSDAR